MNEDGNQHALGNTLSKVGVVGDKFTSVKQSKGVIRERE